MYTYIPSLLNLLPISLPGMQFVKTFNNTVTIWSNNLTTQYIASKDENSHQKSDKHNSIYSSTIYSSKDMEKTLNAHREVNR